LYKLYHLPQINYVKNSKLAGTFRLLSPEEVKSMGKWVISPWCNSNKKVAELFSILRKLYPSFEGKHLSRTEIFKKLYPEKPFNDRWLRNIMAELNKQIESFMVHQRIKAGDPNFKATLLAKEYLDREKNDRFFKNFDTLITNLEEIPNKSRQDFKGLNELYEDAYYTSYKKHKQLHLILQANHNLDSFYLLKKWQYIIELSERKYILNEQIDLFDTDILKKLNKNINLPAIQIYKGLMELKENFEEADLNHYKEKYENEIENLDKIDKILLYQYLKNRYLTYSKSGDPEIYKSIFELYITGIKRNLIVASGRMARTTFFNIVGAGIIAEKYVEIKSFIFSYAHLLEKEDQNAAKDWALATIFFYQDSYHESLKITQKAGPKSEIFNLRIRFLTILNFYKINTTDSSYESILTDTIISFIKYLKRNKSIINRRKVEYKTGVAFIKQLSNLSTSISERKTVLEGLLDHMNDNKPIAARIWMRKEIEKLLKQ